jgi:hypothetical protein
MADAKTKVEAPEKKPPRPVSMEQTEEREKDAGPARPLVQRAAQTSNAAPTAPGPAPARAADMLAGAEPGAGAPGRARAMTSLQQSVGNEHTGQLMAKSSSGTDTTAIQRAKKGPAPKKPPPITLPLPKEAARKPSGAAEFQVGAINIVALPDKKSSKPIIVNGKKRDAMTHVSLHWDLPGAKYQGGKVIAVDPVPAPTLTIRTTYGPKAGPETKSSYGKGTTPEDIKAGKTSLGYHEGSHGEYAIQYTKDHPLPAFKGMVGMSVGEYKEALAEYDQEMETYRQALDEYHKIMTDCVGQKGEGCND